VVLAVPRDADVQRFAALSAGFGGVLELPAEKRQLFNVLHSISSGEEVHEGVVRLKDYAKREQGASRLRILIADDNPTNREVLRRILERGGHTVVSAIDGDQALDVVEQGQFDIVLLDRNMPGLSGLETLQAIRLMTRGRERIPVVMLSADVTPEAKAECLQAGADSFLPKPIEALRLLEELRSLTSARKAKDASRPGLSAAIADAPAETHAAEIVSVETLAHLEELGSTPDFLERLVGVFVADSLSLLAKMESAVATRNFGEFRAHLHAMKGSAASIGTERLTRMCASLGKLSETELRLQSPRLVASLEKEFAQGRAALESYVKERRGASTAG
jgi:two-component system sensor histidine kinase RpfC